MTFSKGLTGVAPDSERRAEHSSPRGAVVRALLVALLGFAALVGWSFASPIGASPDDNFHLVSIWCAPGERPGLCEATANPNERSVLAVLADSSACYAFHPAHNGNCEPPLTGMTTTGHGNFTGLYPPVYYAVMSVFSSHDVQTSVLLMRVFNSLLCVSLVTALYLLVDRKLRTPLLWGLLLTAIPMGVFLIASVNPNGWAIVSAGTTWIAIVGFFRAPTMSRQIALATLAFVAVLMGAGSRGDSAAYVALGAAIAAIVSFERTRRYLASLIVPLVAVGTGAAFYLSSSQAGEAVGTGLSGGATPAKDFVAGFIHTLLNIPQLWVGNFGTQALAWNDVKMPAVVWFTVMALYVGVAFWALSQRRDARTNIATLLAGIALVIVPSWVITQSHVEVGVLVQPRYILPLQVLFIGLLVFGAREPKTSMTKIQLWLVVAGLGVSNAIALYLTYRRFLTGTDYSGLDLNKNIEWWWTNIPITPDALWAVPSLAFLGLLVVVTGVLTRQRTEADELTPPQLQSLSR